MKITIELDNEDVEYISEVLFELDVDSCKLSTKAILELVNKLPKNIISKAYQWGWGDTVVRDELYIFFSKTSHGKKILQSF